MNESDPRSDVHYLGSSENKAWKNGLHLLEQKENLMIGHQVRVTFAATISQLTTTKEKKCKNSWILTLS